MDIKSLKKKAVDFRRQILETLEAAGSGHPGGSLSAVEIFLVLYGCQLKHRPADPCWDDRDRVIVSKGHVTPVVYVTLANFGYFSKEELKTFRKFGSRLQGHVHTKVPGVEFNTGSLGHGLSFANGVALGAKMRGKNFKVYCVMGDGELQEGSVWEAAMTAAHHKLDNVCAVVDYNKVQENGPTNEIKNLEPLAQKWSAFGWHVLEVDGHSIEALKAAFDDFNAVRGRPTVIIANTFKGRGISFMEGKCAWHGKAPNKEQLAMALRELIDGD
ncbi:MAG: transketolase [Candidatus Omnitrophica bacterium]|nr:transketolase [Candidatus Omnitrophota bacterium]MDE2009039.1 transketolase [Candidatus Omnitrophota bacterium]MDE2214296.1 transketolase [Candidatus Omnitrophota bacterium]MDE2231333.1 transketolase [Candidatus Omnitrophota bacterium]